MLPSALARPHTVVTLVLVSFAVVSLPGCRNLFQVCGPALVIAPTWDSTSVGRTVTFQAVVEGGGCGFAKPEAATADAVWRGDGMTKSLGHRRATQALTDSP